MLLVPRVWGSGRAYAEVDDADEAVAFTSPGALPTRFWFLDERRWRFRRLGVPAATNERVAREARTRGVAETILGPRRLTCECREGAGEVERDSGEGPKRERRRSNGESRR